MSLSMEQCILGTILQLDLMPCGDDMQKTIDFIPDEKYFTHPVHKIVIKAMNRLRDKEYPPTNDMVIDELKIDQMDENFKIVYNDLLCKNPLVYSVLLRYYENLKEGYRRNMLKAVL